jgi:hypothetical protein
MRYHPATDVRSSTCANTGDNALHRPISMRPGDRDEAMRRQAAEFDVWEDEGGATAGEPPEFPNRRGF